MAESPTDTHTKWEGDIGPLKTSKWDNILQMTPRIVHGRTTLPLSNIPIT